MDNPTPEQFPPEVAAAIEKLSRIPAVAEVVLAVAAATLKDDEREEAK